MRINVLVTCSLALVAVLAPSLHGEEASDHPLVGRFAGATIQHQEVSSFGAYEMPTGEDETARMEGEVWMTLYEAPDDASTFTIYSTYLRFLEEEGFELLVSFAPGETPPQYLRRIYELAPFADHGNYNHSAPITNGNEAVSSYIAARRERPDSTIWVSAAIAEGWYDYPQYKLDVVVEGGNSGSIMSSGTEAASAADTSAGDSPMTRGERGGSIRIRAGLQGYMLLDPALAGTLSISTASNGDETVSSRGIRNVWGPFVEAVWFPRPHLGVSLHATRLASLVDFYANNTEYSSELEMIAVRLGIHTRILASDGRAHLMGGLGLGVAGTTVRFKSEGAGYTEFAGDDPLPVFASSLEAGLPLPGIFGLTAGCEYLFMPFERFTLSNTQNESSISYVEGNFGGLTLQLGVTAALR